MSFTQRSEVIVIGAGPAGLAAAIGCHDAGLTATVVDTSPAASSHAATGRSAALFNTTIAFLARLGVWDRCEPHAEPLRALQFIDDTGRRLRAPDALFKAAEIGEEAFGCNIANADLARALKEIAAEKGIAILTPGPLRTFHESATRAILAFENGIELYAPLAIAADGRNSATREAAGIRALTWPYEQTAMAASFSHARPHNGLCIEFHRNGGPFTLIPLPGNRSSFVWTERKADTARLMGLDDEAFAREMEKASHFALGRIFDLSQRGAFPLSALMAREFGRARVALVGEAAHAVPPIGAQGLNLGFRDVEALLGLLVDAKAANADLGGEDLLRDYSAARRGDIVSRTLGVDLLNRSLLSSFLPMQAARGLGLYALGAIGPLRRAFMRRGMAPAGPVQ
ncbi:Ubiquinone biosynthesis hydroxylase, UbiH/UbiF/VisC/COQ6 family [Rhodomicrobium vannielii ATCC 17100]|uniref:Ubiquinone biosynthesis hydroxylase, UbiH/UbiF/VisC/COQ6 family n=1 Tax=Rhodomicrobium vannielii (strain ATCC 17100 / DSM 162 / LMG 4299 / NCIMB 10020 / ATH 3.1.1) TaxID=648757 RepID=E3I4Q4_RHOVT|nr:FAD-dependent monooxygenase [Rhodomicrobium vannielii]ADP72726.1 Ubiquinone biosynthesis hydroxylase, UbiH/UbiF/VisC/COQ6 family [Rhodomicrobium vannielii ATCC 17100]